MHRSLTIAVLSLAAAGTVAAQAKAPNLTDPEVAHVAVTANTIDIDAGKLALSRSKNSDVRAFAEMMVRDHGAVNARASALANKLNVTPKANAVSQSLDNGAAEARARLEKLNGKAFDQAYMEREIAFHQAVLDALDGVLIPTTENAELKQLLVEVRPAIAAHLEYARQVDAKVLAVK